MYICDTILYPIVFLLTSMLCSVYSLPTGIPGYPD